VMPTTGNDRGRLGEVLAGSSMRQCAGMKKVCGAYVELFHGI
jgi:hypothetical protein